MSLGMSRGRGARANARAKPVYKNIYDHVYGHVYGLTRRGHATANPSVATRSGEYVAGMVQRRFTPQTFCDQSQLVRSPTVAAGMTST